MERKVLHTQLGSTRNSGFSRHPLVHVAATLCTHKAPVRRTGTSVETHREEEILHCCMVVTSVARCTPCIDTTRSTRGRYLDNSRTGCTGMFCMLVLSSSLKFRLLRTNFLLYNDNGMQYPSSVRRLCTRPRCPCENITHLHSYVSSSSLNLNVSNLNCLLVGYVRYPTDFTSVGFASAYRDTVCFFGTTV